MQLSYEKSSEDIVNAHVQLVVAREVKVYKTRPLIQEVPRLHAISGSKFDYMFDSFCSSFSICCHFH